MTNPTNDMIQNDIGDAWGIIENNTTVVANAQIGKAQDNVRDITGTTTGNTQDRTIRALADAYMINRALSIFGPETDNKNNLVDMRNQFLNEADQALRKVGKALNYHSIQFSQVNP